MAALRSILFLVAAAVASAPAAAQASPESFDAGQYFAPFALVCLKDFGNAAKQVQLASNMQQVTGKPMWTLKSKQVDGAKTLLSFEGATIFIDPDSRKSCSVAMQTAEAVSLDDFATGIAKNFGGIRPTKQNEEMVWILKVGGESSSPLLLAASTSSEAGKNSVRLRIQESGL